MPFILHECAIGGESRVGATASVLMMTGTANAASEQAAPPVSQALR